MDRQCHPAPAGAKVKLVLFEINHVMCRRMEYLCVFDIEVRNAVENNDENYFCLALPWADCIRAQKSCSTLALRIFYMELFFDVE